MSQIADFVHHGAARITPEIVGRLLHELPLLKAEFTQIHTPKFPHLIDQLNFLADFVEDFAEGQAKGYSYLSFAHAVFALLYAHQRVDIIPDHDPRWGHADDSSVARAVIILFERDFRAYALHQKIDWSHITSDA